MIWEVTCHTEGCENNGIAITMETNASTFICGCCGVEISDKQPVNLNTETTQE